MAEFISSGRAIDVILVTMAIEVAVLLILRERRRAVVTLAEILMMLIPGLFLLLALRAALQHLSWVWVALFLVLAFAAHLADLRLRWSRETPAAPSAGKHGPLPARPRS